MKSNHFDFNKSFLHGVSMLRRSDEQRILDDISSASKHKAAGDKMEINKNNIKTLKAVFDQVCFHPSTQRQIQQWINVIQKGSDEDRANLPQRDGKYYLVLDPVNSYFRRLIYQEAEGTYGKLLSVVKLDEDNKVFPLSSFHSQDCKGNTRRLRVYFNPPSASGDDTSPDVNALRIQEVKKLVGLRRVLELISGKRLPLVGFEMMNDLMFLYHWAIEKLPASCADFMRVIHAEFPMVIDVCVGAVADSHLRVSSTSPRSWTCFPNPTRWRASTRAYM